MRRAAYLLPCLVSLVLASCHSLPGDHLLPGKIGHAFRQLTTRINPRKPTREMVRRVLALRPSKFTRFGRPAITLRELERRSRATGAESIATAITLPRNLTAFVADSRHDTVTATRRLAATVQTAIAPNAVGQRLADNRRSIQHDGQRLLLRQAWPDTSDRNRLTEVRPNRRRRSWLERLVTSLPF